MYQRVCIVLLFCLAFFPALSGWAQDKSLPYYQAGNTFYTNKDYGQAVRYYQAAVQLNPNLWQAYQGLGNCSYAQGDKATALTDYQRALDLNPNNPSLSSFVQSLQAPAAPGPSPETASSPSAGSSQRSPSSESQFQLEINAGLALYSSQVGFGGGLSGYIPLGRNFYLGGGGAFYVASESAGGYGGSVSTSSSASVHFIEGMAKAKYLFDGDSMRPYSFAGVGINATSISYSGSAGSGSASVSLSGSGGSQVDPAVALGGGLQFSGGNRMNFEVQLKEELILVPGTTQKVSSYGYSQTVSTPGGTESYTTLEAGLNFDL